MLQLTQGVWQGGTPQVPKLTYDDMCKLFFLCNLEVSSALVEILRRNGAKDEKFALA